MELEQIIADINSTKPKTGFTERLRKVREIIQIGHDTANLLSTDFNDHSDHSNHSDWNGKITNPIVLKKLLNHTKATDKKIAEINTHTDHGDHNDFSDHHSKY